MSPTARPMPCHFCDYIWSLGGRAMRVEQIPPRARERLAILEVGTPVSEAAGLMARPHTDLVVICDLGIMRGVVTKTDIVAEVIRRPPELALAARLDTIMTREVVSCRADDALVDVWLTMESRDLQRIPVVDVADRPIGVVYTRDALRALLNEVEIEGGQLRDYVVGIGYR
jgi:CBS domain-containing protein